jgi:hypothetical protein
MGAFKNRRYRLTVWKKQLGFERPDRFCGV